MKIFAYIYLVLFISTALFFFVATIVEKHVPEESTFMKWWRKHIIGKAPQNMDI